MIEQMDDIVADLHHVILLPLIEPHFSIFRVEVWEEGDVFFRVWLNNERVFKPKLDFLRF